MNAQEFSTFIKVAVGIAGAALSEIFGGWDGALMILVGFIILDFITGAMASEHGLSSERARKGLKRKIGYLLAVVFGVMIDRLTGEGRVVRDGIITALSLTEGMSIVENFGRLGVPLPPFVKRYFEILRENKGGVSNGQDTQSGTTQGTDKID